MATTVLGLKTFTASDPVDYNEINDNYVKIDNGVKTAMQGRAAHNLLDNSNFKINQQGSTSYTANGYTVDRWAISKWSNDSSVSINLSVNNNGVSLTGGVSSASTPTSCYIYQKIDCARLAGKTLTAAVYIESLSGSGTGIIGAYNDQTYIKGAKLKAGLNFISFDVPGSATVLRIMIGNDASIGGQGSITASISWAALYEGSYDASTLPAYQPKGYAAELAECQRYYVHCGDGSWMTGFFKVGEGLVVEIPVANNIRTPYPTIIINSPKIFTTNGWYDITYSSCAVTKCWTKLLFNIPEAANPYIANGDVCIITGIVGVSADL